ncbi:NAD-dependent DNA ligase LigA, partial [candidate division WOR-3 bacterium]|nr:NAD-dependent DNA ligase LigA [candidate division WOR-3 bacterium]
CRNIDEVFDCIEDWREKRHGLEYEVDGLVVKIDDFTSRDRLGSTAKSPRWAIAFKYPARQASTVLKEIQLQVGRTGRITPVALLDPVFLSGSTISRATLHNEDEIIRRDIRVGDHVLIEKGGEVIPKVIGVLKAKRTGRERTFRFPEKCPACRQKIYRLPDEADWRCVNSACPAQIKGKILHFASRTAMDIEGLGDVLADKFVDLGLVRGFDGLYRLDVETLANVERMGKRSAENLVQAIERSKQKPFVNVLYALGIPHVGISVAHLLVDQYGSIEDIMNASVEQLTGIPGVGEVIAESINNYFNVKQNAGTVYNLKKAGLNFTTSTPRRRKGTLAGKTFVFTGELRRMSRREAHELVRDLGGRASSSVSRRTDYVVKGTEPGSKLQEALKLGIVIITEDEFLKLVR